MGNHLQPPPLIPSSDSMAILSPTQFKGCPPSSTHLYTHATPNIIYHENFNFSTRRKTARGLRMTQSRVYCTMGMSVEPIIEISQSEATKLGYGHGVAGIITCYTTETKTSASALLQNLLLMDLDPATAKTLITFLGPFLSAFAFLFILRIVMSWYPKLPVEKFPYIIAYAPTEPLLIPTRKLIPPLAGVDVTPVVWFGLLSFLNEILVGPQGLLVLLSQKI